MGLFLFTNAVFSRASQTSPEEEGMEMGPHFYAEASSVDTKACATRVLTTDKIWAPQ